jgi:protein arginine N-methyltransferase 1
MRTAPASIAPSTFDDLDPVDLLEPRNLLGQFIPPQYHYTMLANPARMQAFREAIERLVQPGHRVLEFGGGTGVLSCFAARRGATVRCIEYNPALVAMARPLLERNGVADRVELIEGDACTYLPPEPVDVVICEMIHTGLLREKQAPVIAAFKDRYRRRFGVEQMPRFIPEAVVSALQPVQQDYTFFGYDAPGPLFLDPGSPTPGTIGLADPQVYQSFLYESPFPLGYAFASTFTASTAGTCNAVRMVTRNLVGILVDERRSIDWTVHHIVFPLPRPIAMQPGDQVQIALAYRAGDELSAVADTLTARRVGNG